MGRPLRALQVEVTSRCTRRCAVCPRSVFGNRWLEGDLSLKHWERLRPDLALADHVHLQGWGEPLLHPQIESMARGAKEAGCRVGLTTNSELLGDAVEWLVDGPVDVVAVSMAGGGEWNSRLRDGVGSENVLAAVESLATARRRSKKPRIHVSYLLSAGNAGDLTGIVEGAAAAGADEVLVNHIDFVPNRNLRGMAAYRGGGVSDEVRDEVARAEKTARRLRVRFRPPALEPQEMLTCASDPRCMTSVRWDGAVAPCVHLNVPISGKIPRVTDGGSVEIQPYSFGHLDGSSLSDILSGEERRKFIAPLVERCAADARFRMVGFEAVGRGSAGIVEIERAYSKADQALAENPFPAACRGCPKVEGW